MEADLGGWDVSKSTTLTRTFYRARKFTGTGIDKWIVSSVTALYQTFQDADEMNSNLAGWRVERVTTLAGAFRDAAKFKGDGLDSWRTPSVTSLYFAFYGASEVDFDVGGWDVSKLSASGLERTFGSAKFKGTGLGKWDTASVTTLDYTFHGARLLNGAGLEKWRTSGITSLHRTFYLASTMNADLSAWDVSKVRYAVVA